ncbi:MAG: FHA domain-containing protein, partial [Dolichospermum sp.]
PEVYIPPVLTPPPAPVAPEPEAYIPPPYVPQIDPPTIPEVAPAAPPAKVSNTQLQQVVARLFHVQANQEIELPQNLSVIHIGKPNDRIPPDIDVSGFANSEIVSRIHADIRIEGDACYIEDAGSSNGTYINNLPLLPGNRHRLRPGDRISLGKGDLVTFLFQLS